VWDADTGRELFPLNGHLREVGSVAWSPDGLRLATASQDGTTRVWDATDGRNLLTLEGHVEGVWSVSWSPDGRRLATAGGDRTARVWDAAIGHELFRLEGQLDVLLSVSWSPDGRRLATGGRDRAARVCDADTGRMHFPLNGHLAAVWSVAWSPDGLRLATASLDGTAKVWDATDGRELLTLKGHAGGVWSVSWSPDGKRLATGSEDGTAKVWDTTDGRELLTLKGQGGWVNTAAWSPDGLRLATGSGDGAARLWDAVDAEAVQRWARQDREMVDIRARNVFRGPRAQGFLRDWLVLLPIPLAADGRGPRAVDLQQLPGEAGLRPRPGDRATVGGKELIWQEYHSPEAVLDLNAVMKNATEWSVAYAVCYIESDRARGELWLQVGSDYEAKAYLNGQEIYRCRVPRSMESLDTAGPVALKQGTNVLVLKVVNERWNWEACARLVDEEWRPAEGLP
jgi:Tol biopolymer transport system component